MDCISPPYVPSLIPVSYTQLEVYKRQRDALSGRRSLMTQLEKGGELFGEVYLFLGSGRYDVHAEALESSAVLELPGRILGAACFEDSGLSGILQQNLLAIFARKAYALNRRVRVLGRCV